MGDVLLTRDARTIRSLTGPRWLRRALVWIIFVAAAVVMGLQISAEPPQGCTVVVNGEPAAPITRTRCTPTPRTGPSGTR